MLFENLFELLKEIIVPELLILLNEVLTWINVKIDDNSFIIPNLFQLFRKPVHLNLPLFSGEFVFGDGPHEGVEIKEDDPSIVCSIVASFHKCCLDFF